MDDKDLRFGITEFLNEGAGGFDGQLKCRLSDFLVNEVDTNGEIVRLTKLGIDKDMLREAAPTISDAGPLTADLIELITQFLTSGKKTIEIPVGPGDSACQERLLSNSQYS
ncbi:hypothetical protein RvY_13735 [Ramazzottius varieornatus]|uniref:Uncharacterized protein n=1 Tax=Ramazzottius varieornatus TaxID=947166 RepID=A0A1D1VNX4_RAMVA|nr:hypothetical protein RvY_13735 [Ramazzottius varieornatus]